MRVANGPLKGGAQVGGGGGAMSVITDNIALLSGVSPWKYPKYSVTRIMRNTSKTQKQK